jgi:hypothetical protein
MTLKDLITAVKEDNLSKDQLESYHSELCNLKSQLYLELADLKKSKALFMVRREQGESIASRKESWDATKEGQRKFEIEAYISSTKALTDSIKSRLYSIY